MKTTVFGGTGSTSLLDVTNAPSYDKADIQPCFETGTENLCAASVKHGVHSESHAIL